MVERGYDHIAERFAEWASGIRSDERAHGVSVLLERLPVGAQVLELGCGAGIPTTQQLAQRFAVTGVDISARQLELARQNVPNARFIHADMTQLEFPEGTFDAVAALYSIIHVPRAEHPKLIRAIARWLRPGGLFLAALGARATEAGVEDDWLGAPMYWSHFDSATNLLLIEQAGLRIVRAREETLDEDGVPVTFLWVMAEKLLQQPDESE